MSWIWVRTDAELEAAINEASTYEAVALDTEFRRRDTFFPQVALIQIAAGDHCWIIDPLTVSEPSPLASLLIDERVIKVLHSASEDLEVFEHWLGVLPAPLFDTQRAAAMLGLGFGLSYRSLVEALLGVELAKEETQSDWLKRPLSAAQCEYAAQDVIHLIRCWPLLRDKAHRGERLLWILEEGAQMTTGGKGPLAKFKSAWKLKPEQLAVLIDLIAWREDQARSRNKPRSWILSDKCLSAIATKLPDQPVKLAAIDGIPPGVIRRQGDTLLERVAAVRQRATSSAPEVLPRPAGSEIRTIAKALAGSLAGIADELGMNVEILMPNRELELLAREALGEVVTPPPSWHGWRADAVIAPLKRRAIDIVEESHEAG